MAGNAVTAATGGPELFIHGGYAKRGMTVEPVFVQIKEVRRTRRLQRQRTGCSRLRTEVARHHPQHLEDVAHGRSDQPERATGVPAEPTIAPRRHEATDIGQA